MQKSKSSAVLSLLLVFASGALVGVLADRAYNVTVAPASAGPPHRRSPAEWRKFYIGQMRDRIGLSDEQAAAVETILDQVDDEFQRSREAIQASQVARINAVLRPEQQARLQQFLNEREAERRRRMQQMQGNK